MPHSKRNCKHPVSAVHQTISAWKSRCTAATRQWKCERWGLSVQRQHSPNRFVPFCFGRTPARWNSRQAELCRKALQTQPTVSARLTARRSEPQRYSLPHKMHCKAFYWSRISHRNWNSDKPTVRPFLHWKLMYSWFESSVIPKKV